MPDSDQIMTFWRPLGIYWMSGMSKEGQILTKLGLMSPWCPGDISERYILPNLTSLRCPPDAQTDSRLWCPGAVIKKVSKYEVNRCYILTLYWPKPDIPESPMDVRLLAGTRLTLNNLFFKEHPECNYVNSQIISMVWRDELLILLTTA